MHPHKDVTTDDSLINEPSTKKDSTTYKRNNERSNLHIELKKKKRRTIIVNTICICIILFGIGWVTQYFWRYYEYEITNDASIEEYITPINSRVSGYIKEVRFKEHEKVKAGDTLVIIDDSEFKIKVLDAEASLKDAEASKNVMISNLQSSLKNVSVSEANISEAKVRMDNAYKDYIRYENLWKEESVPQQLYDLKKADYEAYRAKYQSLINQKQANISNTEGVSKKQENADAQILRSKANLEMAKLNLSYTVIKAPYDGYVGRKNIEVGELVQAGQVLTNIIKNNDKWVIANYKEKQIANIYEGQEVNIYVDAIKDKTFKGKVTAISEATGSKYSMIPTDNAAGNFVKIQQRIPVRIDFIDLNQTERTRLRAGMMVETEAKIK
ncbi:HlyD family secretion protein [Apibacter muscae]|uniref:HlyD family secretion protein n=2 Tax=Apibacter muscae TaxID=2509004 RepID=A0A563DC20_9FLAO|nr:HlyD family secretion protein [Apibacter muscae]TWP29680.1 HlyD family secretion protein [Apibacter muscae]